MYTIKQLEILKKHVTSWKNSPLEDNYKNDHLKCSTLGSLCGFMGNCVPCINSTYV